MYRFQRRMMTWEFKFINLDKGEHTQEGDPQHMKNVVVTADNLVSLLRKPEWVEFKINPANMHFSKEKNRDNCKLMCLPQEMIDKICKNLVNEGNGAAVICLALSNSYFFRLLGGDLQKLLAGNAGKWAGDRVVFASDLARGIAEGIGSPEEEAEWWANRYTSLTELKTTEIKPYVDKKARLPKTAPEIFAVPGEFIIDAKAIMNMKRDHKGIALLDSVLLILQQPLDVPYQQKPPILRNLDTKEFVRADGCVGLNHREASLGEALMAFTCFVGDHSWKPNNLRWIGHRFDISPAKSIEGEEGWVDVTRQATDGIKYNDISLSVWRQSLDRFLLVAQPTAFAARMKALDDERAAEEAARRAAAGEVIDDSSSGSVLLIQQN
ncbi:hypothetical protein HG530_001994 [Fusarium avenaceum]|nr:hypothetical protein HG530_001994 [Fusarium avenaceum]